MLDAGCGWGTTLVALERRGYRVSGMDISRRTLQQLDRPDRKLILADLSCDLPTGAGGYDAVFALDVIEHIDDDGDAVRKLGELVRPGGFVIVSVPALPELFTEFDEIQGHRRRYDPERLRSAFDGAGARCRTNLLVGPVAGPFTPPPARKAKRKGGRLGRGDLPPLPGTSTLARPHRPADVLRPRAEEGTGWEATDRDFAVCGGPPSRLNRDIPTNRRSLLGNRQNGGLNSMVLPSPGQVQDAFHDRSGAERREPASRRNQAGAFPGSPGRGGKLSGSFPKPGCEPDHNQSNKSTCVHNEAETNKPAWMRKVVSLGNQDQHDCEASHHFRTISPTAFHNAKEKHSKRHIKMYQFIIGRGMGKSEHHRRQYDHAVQGQTPDQPQDDQRR